MKLKFAHFDKDMEVDEKSINAGLKGIAKETGISMDELCLFGLREVLNHYNGIVIGKVYKSDLTEIFKKKISEKKRLKKKVKKTVNKK